MKKNNTEKRLRIHKKIRSRIMGTEERPRLAVFRSNAYIYAQIINDDTKSTVAAASDLKLGKMSKMDRAKKVGEDVAAAAKKAGVSKVVFDRGGFAYKGRVAALAEAARNAGLVF
jgi:large subunit ribosomal protein L18